MATALEKRPYLPSEWVWLRAMCMIIAALRDGEEAVLLRHLNKNTLLLPNAVVMLLAEDD